jgi:hypothetical protein
MDKYFMWIFGSVFGLVGLVFLVVAIFTVRSELAFRAVAISAPGTVVDLEPTSGSRGGTTYKPVFEFTDRDDHLHRVTGSVASSPPSFKRGEAVRVLYQPENPDQAHLDSFMDTWFLPLIFGTLGTVFTSIAGGCLIYGLRRRTRRTSLIASGTRIQARVDGVEHDRNTSVNGRNPWRIVAQWQHPVDQKVYVFRSDSIWFDPTPYLHQSVDVLVDIDHPHRYVMDTDFLPKPG